MYVNWCVQAKVWWFSDSAERGKDRFRRVVMWRWVTWMTAKTSSNLDQTWSTNTNQSACHLTSKHTSLWNAGLKINISGGSFTSRPKEVITKIKRTRTCTRLALQIRDGSCLYLRSCTNLTLLSQVCVVVKITCGLEVNLTGQYQVIS